jgi:hypothetical protein
MAEEQDTPELREFIHGYFRRVDAELRGHRRETREQTELLAAFHRSVSTKLERLNRRLDEMQGELLDTIKIEIGGGMAMMETRLEERLEDSIEQRLADAIKRIDALERSAGGED